MTEILHLPRFERVEKYSAYTQKLISQRKNSQSLKETTLDDSLSLPVTEFNSPTLSKKTTITRASSSGYGSGSSGTQSVSDVTYEQPDILSFADQSEQDANPLNESQTDEPDASTDFIPDADYYGILHGSATEYSIVTIKVNVRDDDVLSVSNDNLPEQNTDKDVQTVAMPMLWHSSASTASVNHYAHYQSRVSLSPVSAEYAPSIPSSSDVTVASDVVDGVTTTSVSALGCLESSRRHLWGALTKCRSMVSHIFE